MYYTSACHTRLFITRQKIIGASLECVATSSVYSPDLAPCALQNFSNGTNFNNDDDVKTYSVFANNKQEVL